MVRTPPSNIEAEQALLGAILVNDALIDRAPKLEAEHFYDPVHGRIWSAAKALRDDGKVVTPVTLKTAMDQDAGFLELGGFRYLRRLLESATTINHISDYVEVIEATAVRRRMIAACAKAQELCMDGSLALADMRRGLEDMLFDAIDPAVDGGGWLRGHLLSSLSTISDAYRDGVSRSGISSGLPSLDRRIGGYRPGKLYLLAGRPSAGKTALALHCALEAARSGVGVLFVSLEMSAEEVSERAMSAATVGGRERAVPQLQQRRAVTA
jgi:replicative DNA helicase